MSRIECTEVTDSLEPICTTDADDLLKHIQTVSLIEILPEARCCWNKLYIADYEMNYGPLFCDGSIRASEFDAI